MQYAHYKVNKTAVLSELLWLKHAWHDVTPRLGFLDVRFAFNTMQASKILKVGFVHLHHSTSNRGLNNGNKLLP